MKVRLPAGLATVLGALPAIGNSDVSRLMAGSAPDLPAAPTVELRDAAGPAGALAAVGEFLESFRGRIEPVVLSITGPVTVELDLLAKGLDPARAAESAFELVTSVGQGLVDLAGQLLPGAPVLLFLEEPGLVNSMHPTFPLLADQIEALVRRTVVPLSDRAMVGVHVDGRTDWSLLLRTGIGVLGAPITARLETAADELARFLAAGGFVAWGAVPVDEPLGAGSDRLWRRLSALWSDLAGLGLDPLLLREQSIITPAAGLGNFGVSQAERVLRLSAEIGDRVLTQVRGARLSVGA